MRSIVTKMAPALVAPSKLTPSGYLPLSVLDRFPAMRSYVDMVHVYKHGRGEPAEVAREALAEALVPYYPIAGRFRANSVDGKLSVDCTGEGVWFVEASAGCRLEDVDYLQCQPFKIPGEQLLPAAPPGVDENALTFMMQVTKFTCGGFAIGFRTSHCIFDAIGVGQFLLAISEMGKGLAQPTVIPVWSREKFPGPANFQPEIIPQLKPTPPPLPPALKLEHCTMDVSLEATDRLKNSFAKATGKTCTAFDILTAMIWQCRTRAAGPPPPDAELTLNFPANIRPQLRKELTRDGGYYGNCIYHVLIKAPSGKIADAPFFEVVELISDAKESLSTKFSRWLMGDPTENPLPLSFTYESMSITDLRRVRFDEADYGWGPPDHIVPIFDHPIGLCLFLNSPPPMKGTRFMTQCVVKEHLQAFQNEMSKFS